MMLIRCICLFLSLTFFLTCGKEDERYLYDKYDSEYSVLQLYAQSECIKGSNFFTSFDAYADFDKAIFKEGDIYKITQDANTDLEIFVKVEKINPTNTILIYNSTINDYDKILVFEESDHVDIGTFLKALSCHPDSKSYFSSISGLGSALKMGFTWFKETITILDGDDSDSEPDAYRRRTDRFIVDLEYPSLFYFYNAEKTYQSVVTAGKDETKTVSKITIKEVTEADECDVSHVDYHVSCAFSLAAVSRNCTVDVNTSAHKLRPHDAKTLTMTGDSGCKLMLSTGGI